jgi:hypothetical protein
MELTVTQHTFMHMRKSSRNFKLNSSHFITINQKQKTKKVPDHEDFLITKLMRSNIWIKPKEKRNGNNHQCLKCLTLVKRSETPYLLQQSTASPSLMLPPGSAITLTPLSHASSTVSFQAVYRTNSIHIKREI